MRTAVIAGDIVLRQDQPTLALKDQGIETDPDGCVRYVGTQGVENVFVPLIDPDTYDKCGA